MSIPTAPKKYTDPFRSMVEWWTYKKNWEDGIELVVLTPEDKVLVFPCKCRESDMLFHFEWIAGELPSTVGTTIMANLPMYERTRLLTSSTFTKNQKWEQGTEKACKRILKEYNPLHSRFEDRWEAGYWGESVSDSSPFFDDSLDDE